MKKNSKTKQSKEEKIIKFEYERWRYQDGDTDTDGKAHGYGEADNLYKTKKYRGTFYEDVPHGLGMSFLNCLTIQFQVY